MSDWAVEKSSSRRKKSKRTNNRKAEKRKRKTDHEKTSRKLQKVSEIEFRYKTSLPDPIGRPKLLQVPLPPDYLTRYMGAELETQRQWNLHSENGMAVPIDVWDPVAYKASLEEQERCDEDADLLAMIYQRTSKSSDDHKLNKSHYYGARLTSWTLNPDIMTNQTRVKERKAKAANAVREVDTKFANKTIIENLEKQKQSLLSVESIQQTFKDIDNLKVGDKHPKNPDLTVVESIPIFPDDRILENDYSHISFDRPPIKEAIKLPFLNEKSDDVCHDATNDSVIRVSEHRNKLWYSMYTPDKSKGTELDHELEWTSEYHRRFEGKSDFSHFFVRVGHEIVWGQISNRTKLGRVETENITSNKSFNRADRETFAGLPRYLGIETIPDQEEDEMSDEE